MIEINIIETQKVLSPTQISLADYAINPYRGCEFGCLYCYSQENKNIKNRKQEWGKFVDVKIDAPAVLRNEISYIKPRKVILGTTTECFQPQELKFNITRQIIEILREKDIPLVILTKSSLIENYLDIISYSPENKIYFTFMFTDCMIKNLLEKDSPDLQKRIKTINKIMEKRIKSRIHIGPYIPHLQNLEDIFKLIPKGINEVEIEVYNFKMGNFPKMLEIINENTGENKSRIIEDIYSSKDTYDKFCDDLKENAETLNKTFKFKLNFIIPDYNFWYTDKIKYD